MKVVGQQRKSLTRRVQDPTMKVAICKTDGETSEAKIATDRSHCAGGCERAPLAIRLQQTLDGLEAAQPFEFLITRLTLNPQPANI